MAKDDVFLDDVLVREKVFKEGVRLISSVKIEENVTTDTLAVSDVDSTPSANEVGQRFVEGVPIGREKDSEALAVLLFIH